MHGFPNASIDQSDESVPIHCVERSANDESFHFRNDEILPIAEKQQSPIDLSVSSWPTH
jgi:hypothetical protein